MLMWPLHIHPFVALQAPTVISMGRMRITRFLTAPVFADVLSGFTILISTALLSAKTTLYVPSSSLVRVGAKCWYPLRVTMGYLQRCLSLIVSLRVLVLLIIGASIIPLYGVIGLFAPYGAWWVCESQQRCLCS